MPDAIGIKFDTTGIFAGLDALGEAATVPVRPAAQAGAQVLYDEVHLRVPVSTKRRKLKSGRIAEPGALKRAIYQVFSEDNSNATRATYHVSWNAKKAPHGHLVEHGTSRMPAKPFLRPAYDARYPDALRVARDRWAKDAADLIARIKK